MKRWMPYTLAALILLLGSAVLVRGAIQQLAGLAVAQSSTQWNNLKDMITGDGQTSGVALSTPCLWNGSSCDRQRGSIANGALVDVTRLQGGTVTPSDSFTNPSTALSTWSLQGLFNRSTSGWDREQTISSTSNTATTSQGTAYMTPLSTWSVTHTPAVATQATASKAAGGTTVRHVATSVTVCVAAGATAQTPILFHLRDGASGAGTILRTWAFSAPVNTGVCDSVSGLNMTGSANTAMTIESAAAPVAGAQATVTLTGYSTP